MTETPPPPSPAGRGAEAPRGRPASGEQEQFLDVVDRDTAYRGGGGATRPETLPAETVPLDAALGRVLARDLTADVDVPSFDRSNMDGFALRAGDTFGASEEAPRRLRLG